MAWLNLKLTCHHSTTHLEHKKITNLSNLALKFPSADAHFSDHNSDEIYFSLLNVIIFFIISDKIHISSLKLYF